MFAILSVLRIQGIIASGSAEGQPRWLSCWKGGGGATYYDLSIVGYMKFEGKFSQFLEIRTRWNMWNSLRAKLNTSVGQNLLAGA